MKCAACILLIACAAASLFDDSPEWKKLQDQVVSSEVFQRKVHDTCASVARSSCEHETATALFCQLLKRSRPAVAVQAGCFEGTTTAAPVAAVSQPHDVGGWDVVSPFGDDKTAKKLEQDAARSVDVLIR
eukprot:gnl/TRDRNA2_/TRDRNA2_192317_c0_seq1.p1 gnl/TRDRNA2_/TRDRNA2_192317_c0~~gnl/TRDRNA2_/TRDRNA2_192317_c0_seq1.p1  ORF type:complete len:130 (+),score=22.17 gnl/TRDRNA2_/TRDRNA2_192317_c0_seq1:190-579(+)